MVLAQAVLRLALLQRGSANYPLLAGEAGMAGLASTYCATEGNVFPRSHAHIVMSHHDAGAVA